MESQYYSVVLVKFELVCYYCGFGGDGSLVQDEEISQLCVCGFICFFVKWWQKALSQDAMQCS